MPKPPEKPSEKYKKTWEEFAKGEKISMEWKKDIVASIKFRKESIIY